MRQRAKDIEQLHYDQQGLGSGEFQEQGSKNEEGDDAYFGKGEKYAEDEDLAYVSIEKLAQSYRLQQLCDLPKLRYVLMNTQYY